MGVQLRDGGASPSPQESRCWAEDDTPDRPSLLVESLRLSDAEQASSAKGLVQLSEREADYLGAFRLSSQTGREFATSG